VFTITTWNVQNLFPAGHPDGPRTDALYDAKIDALAEAIRTLDPDVLALQEVADAGPLDDLLRRAGGRWFVEWSNAPDARGIRVALAARAQLAEVEQAVDLAPGLDPVRIADDDDVDNQADAYSTRVGRGALHATVETDIGGVEVVTAHLKSKLISYPGPRFTPRDENERARYAAYALHLRGAESTTLRVSCNTRLDGGGERVPLILLGDMNDEPSAATTQILLGPPGSEIGTAGERVADRGDGDRLWNLSPLLPPEQQFSRIYRGRPELIDHIFVSRALLTRVVSVSSGTATDSSPTLPSVADDPSRLRDLIGSDHAPITATLDISRRA
jgi:endonuclease/exonuclease/phosphatase family metal-dependent hydrolase